MDLRGLPGEEFVRKGMQDLKNGELETPEALLVSMAGPKLESLGLEVADVAYEIEEPELKLYEFLGQTHPNAYQEYNALRNRLGKFERALQARVSRAHLTSSVA